MKTAKPLIATLTAATLALPVLPVSVVSVVSVSALSLSTAPAFAKGGNGGGREKRDKSDRGGGGGRGVGKTTAASQGARGNSGNAYGQQKVNQSSATAKLETETETTGPGAAGMHPSELGSMNGALHANINAVLAHIRNGNVNGPVGALAGLAVADAGVAAAAELFGSEEYGTLDTALTDAGFDSLAAYREAVENGEIEEIDGIEDALAAFGETSEDDIIDAQTALDDQLAAEDGILAAWNKSDEATEEEQAALLAALRDRLAVEADAISETIGSLDVASVEDLEEDLEDEEPLDE